VFLFILKAVAEELTNWTQIYTDSQARLDKNHTVGNQDIDLGKAKYFSGYIKSNPEVNQFLQ
jgi:hypothetical protein